MGHTFTDVFQSTHSLRSATCVATFHYCTRAVSIHALLAECDPQPHLQGLPTTCFNPRTPCGVRPKLSTELFGTSSFNPRTPCGVRPPIYSNYPQDTMFQSTHSLRSATIVIQHTADSSPFQSTHSLRSATFTACHKRTMSEGFNPRTPCGVRRIFLCAVSCSPEFQSTHSLRSATACQQGLTPAPLVSIHALLAECDPQQAGNR